MVKEVKLRVFSNQASPVNEFATVFLHQVLLSSRAIGVLMTFIRVLMTLVCISLTMNPLRAQTVSSVAPAKAESSTEIDFTALIRETQQTPNAPGYAGLVWWIPTQYWEISAERSGLTEERAKERFAPLKKYTVVMVSAGKIGVGNINWFAENEIRENTTLVDADGNIYRPLDHLSGDAQGLASILKPVFSNILGPMGQNTAMLFFAGTDKMARTIADPLRPGSFSIVISNLIAGKISTFEWKPPLTSLSPPKFCPVGHERLEANWKYCPWHGVKIGDDLADGAAK